MNAAVEANPAEPTPIQPSRFLPLILDRRNWSDNPLAVREARREVRRRQPHLSYFWTLLVLSTITVLTLWGLYALKRRGFGIPWLFGGNPGTALCMALCGIHAWFIMAAAQKHSARFIQQEANANTLFSLLMLPIPPFQILLRAAVFPWLAAMRLALIGLPFYALCLALGLPPLDLLLLYLIFAVLSVAIPAWGRPILSEKSALVPVAQTPGVVLAQPANQQNPGAQTSGTGAGAMLMPLIGMVGLLSATAGRGGLRNSLPMLREYLPDSIIQLLPLSFLSWPLLVARALVTPFDWFGIPAPPILFLAASFLLGRYLTTLKSAEFLQVGAYRDLPALPTYARRLRLEGWLRICRIFAATGYLWKLAVVNGGLSFLTTSPGPLAAPGLAGFAFLLMFSGGMRTVFRAANLGHWLSPRPVPPERGFTLKTSGIDSARYLVAPLAFAYVFFMACILIARTSPLQPSIAAMMLQMTLIGIGGAVLAFVVRKVGGEIATLLSVGGLLLIPLIAMGPPEAARLSVLSPTLGLLRYGDPSFLLNLPGVSDRREQVRGLIAYVTSPPQWWQWPLACCAASIPMLPLWKLRRRPRQEPESDSVPPVILNPTRCGNEVYNDWLFEQNRGVKGETTAAVGRLVEAVQKVADNAIAVRELRARLRGRLSAKDIKTIAVILMGVTILMLAAPAVPFNFGGAIAPIALPGLAATPASIVICWYFIFAWLSVFTGVGILPLAFAPEREKSTLGFVLLSPITSTQIVYGKLLGHLLSAGLPVFLVGAWTLVLSLVLLGGSPVALSLWTRVVVSGFALMLTLSAIGIGIAALFPRKTTVGCTIVLVVLAFQVPVFLGIGFGRTLRSTLMAGAFEGWDVHSFWLISLCAGALLTTLGVLAAIWGVRRMRKGDIGFESAKQAA